jgi:hypothetical protein
MDENPYRAPKEHEEVPPRLRLASALRTAAAAAAIAVIAVCAVVGDAVFGQPTLQRFAVIAATIGSALAVTAWWVVGVVQKRPTRS